MAPFYMAFGFYMCAQIGIAIYAFLRKKKQSETEANAITESDLAPGETMEQKVANVEFNQHFAGGKSFGAIPTFLTFFSTAYSGYTVSGIPQESSGIGFMSMWWMSAYNVLNITTLLWKPRLRRLSAVRNWIAFQDPVNDRYNNRLLSGLFVCCGAGGQVIYIIVQMYSLRYLISTITPASDGINPEVMVWIMAGLMLFAEVLGGFGSVVFTDSVQSVIMITSMILVPIIATVHYGGAHNCIAADCPNLETLNCTEGNPLFDRGAACKGSVKINGCLAQPTVAPWLTVHTTVNTMSTFFKPIWATGDGKQWPEYPCTDADGNLTGSMCENPLPGSEVLPATKGTDGVWIFNMQNWIWFQLSFQFLNIGFMPNFVTRFYTANSDLSLKKAAITQVLVGGIIATLPAVLLGIMAGANLKAQYPPGSSAFGMVVSDFNNRGGFSQIVGVTAAVGAIAAFMSTADSSCISITTMITTEFLQNGIFRAFPQYNKPIVMKVFSISCSAVVIFVATATALYDPEINDPESLAYSHMGTLQTCLFQFCTVPCLAGIFLPKASGWACLIGFFAGWTTFFILDIGGWGTNVGTLYFTPFAEEPKHILLRGYLWAFIVNFFVTVPLCLIDLDKMIPTPKVLQINTNKYDPEGKPLRYEQIVSAMEGTTEIIKDKIGIALICISFLLYIFTIPSFGKSHDGCNYISYIGWFNGDGSAVDGCEGPNLCGGLPCFVWPVFFIFPINKVLISLAYTRWKTVDEVEAKFPWGQAKESQEKQELQAPPSSESSQDPAKGETSKLAEIVNI